MLLNLSLRAAARLVLAVALLGAAVPLTASDAEARKGAAARAAVVGGAAVVRAQRANAGEGEREAEAKEEGEAEGDAARAADGSAKGGEASTGTDVAAAADQSQPVRAQSATIASRPAPVPQKDPEVPGCGTGMLCTVCVAGCTGATLGIIHAAPKRN
jgi:hypothetical protein